MVSLFAMLIDLPLLCFSLGWKDSELGNYLLVLDTSLSHSASLHSPVVSAKYNDSCIIPRFDCRSILAIGHAVSI